MARYDIVDTVVGVICDSVVFDPHTGKATIINPSSAVSVDIVSWPETSPADFNFDNVASPLSSLIPNTKTIVFGTAPNVDVSNPTDIAWVSTRTSDYMNDLSTYGAKDSSDNVSSVSNVQNAFPFTLVRSAGGYTLLLMRRPEWSPTTFDEYHWSNFGGFNGVPPVREIYPLTGGPTVDRIEVEPDRYSLTYGQSNLFHIKAYSGDSEVSGIEFEVGPLPEEARGVTLTYPFDDDYTKCRVKMPYLSDGVTPDDFEVPVQYDGIVRTFKVFFYGHGDAYTPGGAIGGGSGIPSGSGGGGGTFPSSPGPSLVDKIPNGQTGNDIAKSGMFTMYLMNQQYMDLMGDIFWEDNLGIAVLKEIFGNPIDSVISTTSYPFNLVNLASSANQNLFFGPWNTGLPFIALTKSSFQIDWGTIEIPFAWGNFLDYSPYTKMELFLPWGPGYVTIDPNDVSPYSNTPGNFNVSTFSQGSIQVKTNIELGKGTCVHSVIGNNGRVIGTYSGIVGKQVPLTALDTGGKALTTIGAVAGLVGGAAVGSLAAKGALDTGRLTAKPVQDPMRPFESSSYWDIGAISGRSTAQSMVSTGANLASRAISSTPITFPRAGTFSDGSSAMTIQEPFLIISRPVQSVPTQYGHYNGYPSNIHVANLNAVSGYTELAEIHLDNVTATADELQELDAILKGGILL